MSAYTALQISDILKLNIADVLDEYGRIRHRLVLRQRKTGKRLEINLPDPLRVSLRRYLYGRVAPDRAEPLFVNLDRNPHRNKSRGSERLSRAGAHNIFKSHLAQTLGVSHKDLAGLSTHALRRSLAMMIYEKHGLAA